MVPHGLDYPRLGFSSFTWVLIPVKERRGDGVDKLLKPRKRIGFKKWFVRHLPLHLRDKEHENQLVDRRLRLIEIKITVNHGSLFLFLRYLTTASNDSMESSLKRL